MSHQKIRSIRDRSVRSDVTPPSARRKTPRHRVLAVSVVGLGLAVVAAACGTARGGETSGPTESTTTSSVVLAGPGTEESPADAAPDVASTSSSAPASAAEALPAKVVVASPSGPIGEVTPTNGTTGSWSCQFFAARSYPGSGSPGLGPDEERGPVDPLRDQPVVLVCADEAGRETYSRVARYDPDRPLAALRAAGLELGE